MANTPLININPGSGLNTGLFPSVEPTSGAIWRDGSNLWFRPLSIVSSLGTEKVINVVGRSSQDMTQAFAEGETRLYYEELGFVYKWDGDDSVLIGELDPEGQFDLEPFGTWLLATDNVGPVGLWKNDLLGFIPIGGAEFTRGKIIKKLANRILIYSTDVLPAGFHYSKPSDPETWVPTVANGAGNLPLRDLDSEIMAVEDLGAAHAVYTEDRMVVVQYLGEGLKFGAPSQSLSGIGACSLNSVVSLRDRNFGLFQNGIFVTDGADYRMVDEPAVRDFILNEIDWTQASTVIGYHDKKMGLVSWSVPVVDGPAITITMDSDFKFSFKTGSFSAGLKQDIFRTGFEAKSNGIHATGSGISGKFTLLTHLLDAGERNRYKAWDYAIFEGTVAGQVRFGFADLPQMEAIEWQPWLKWENLTPFEPRESVFLAMEMQGEGPIKLTGIKVIGSLAGLVT